MKKITFINSMLLMLILSPTCFAIPQQRTAETKELNYIFWIILIIAVLIGIYGLYKSHKREIVVLANLTDVFFVLGSVIIPMITYLLMKWANYPFELIQKTCCIIFIVFTLIIIKATFSYNRNIINFILALYTKMLIPLICIISIVIAIILSASSSRNKYERRKTFSARQTKTVLAGFGLSALIIAIGLESEEFVSIKNYLKGKQN